MLEVLVLVVFVRVCCSALLGSTTLKITKVHCSNVIGVATEDIKNQICAT